MTIEELNNIISKLSDNTEVTIKINKYDKGSIDSGVIGHIACYDIQDIENYVISDKGLVLECTVCL